MQINIHFHKGWPLLDRALARLARWLYREAKADHQLELYIWQVTSDDGSCVEGRITDMNVLEEGRKRVRIVPRTKKGSLAKMDEGTVEWNSSNEFAFTVAEDTNDQLSAIVTAVGVADDPDANSAIITFKGMSQGREITGTGACAVVAGGADHFDLIFEDVADEPASGEGSTELV